MPVHRQDPAWRRTTYVHWAINRIRARPAHLCFHSAKRDFPSGRHLRSGVKCLGSDLPLNLATTFLSCSTLGWIQLTISISDVYFFFLRLKLAKTSDITRSRVLCVCQVAVLFMCFWTTSTTCGNGTASYECYLCSIDQKKNKKQKFINHIIIFFPPHHLEVLTMIALLCSLISVCLLAKVVESFGSMFSSGLQLGLD